MNAIRRVLLGALLGAGVTASVAVPLSGTEAAFADSEQVSITVVAEVPGTPATAARSAVVAGQQFVAAAGARPGAAATTDAGVGVIGVADTGASDGAVVSGRPALPRPSAPSEPAPARPQPAPTAPTVPTEQPPAPPPAGSSAEPAAQPGVAAGDPGPGYDGGAGG